MTRQEFDARQLDLERQRLAAKAEYRSQKQILEEERLRLLDLIHKVNDKMKRAKRTLSKRLHDLAEQHDILTSEYLEYESKKDAQERR